MPAVVPFAAGRSPASWGVGACARGCSWVGCVARRRVRRVGWWCVRCRRGGSCGGSYHSGERGRVSRGVGKRPWVSAT
eukprot:366025-Chlamydomonas_euryale.AAC.1